MDNWDDYRIVLALHRGKTLRNAAQQLCMNHSTVSRRLASLNQGYPTAIFEASPRGYQLTETGLHLLESAQQMEALIIQDQRYKRVGELHQPATLTGKISLSIPPPIMQFLLLEELYEFQRTYPLIRLDIHTSYQIVDLDRCEADIVIRVSNQPAEHLVGKRLFPVALNFYANPSYLQHTPEEHYHWITAPFQQHSPEWIADSPYPLAKPVIGIDDLVMRHYAAAQGQGLVRGACYIAQALTDLQVIEGSKPIPFQDIWILTHPDLRKIPRIQCLMDFLAQKLRQKRSVITGDPS